MDSEVFGRFALHQDSPLGCLAAQLIPGAHTIRYGHEELNMLVEEQNGTEAWQTDLESNLPENLTGSVPLVRFFLPLIRQNLSNVTGGSESVFPLNHFARLRKYYPPCFDEDGRLKGTCLAMNNLAAAPALAPGDLLLYSPLMPHRTQRMLSGSRIGLSGSLYEPSLLIPWVAEVKSLELLTEPPDMGLVCWDKSTKEWHGNLNWQSAGTHGISNGTTACFPQVYPQPQACASSCPSAIPLETSTQVHSRTLLSPSPRGLPALPWWPFGSPAWPYHLQPGRHRGTFLRGNTRHRRVSAGPLSSPLCCGWDSSPMRWLELCSSWESSWV